MNPDERPDGLAEQIGFVHAWVSDCQGFFVQGVVDRYGCLHNEYKSVAAFAVASLLALMALVTLVIKSVVEWRLAREMKAIAELPPERPQAQARADATPFGLSLSKPAPNAVQPFDKLWANGEISRPLKATP